MPVIINSKHASGRSIQDIYLELAKDSTDIVSKEISNNMLKFLDEADKIFIKTPLWALTSHYKLVLQTEDDWKSDWLVKIGCLGNEYYIEYLISEKKRPWPYAYVQGVANGLGEAIKYLLIAMKECEAWKDNDELKKSLEK